MFAEALGIAPLKDTFHSITIQTESDADGDVPGISLSNLEYTLLML